MFFIFLLVISTIAIAGSAAFFSVYGLANTFSGVFWSVVLMGGSLEAGKLIAASYLYRYWDKTTFLLKMYMMAGVVALMVLTSGGIFGYLSSGYQADVLPLKQLESEITLLVEEKGRMLQRKKDIDVQISQLPPKYVTARIRLMREFKDEQKNVTERIKGLDSQVLELKKKQIKTEAHIGPITYIAKAFDVQTDDATKWLVFLIIFAFDPMAVALTLGVNIAIRQREEEVANARREKSKVIVASSPRQPKPEIREVIKEVPVEVIKEVIKEVEVPVDREVIKEVIKEVPVEKIVYVETHNKAAIPEKKDIPVPTKTRTTQPIQPGHATMTPSKSNVRTYAPKWTEGVSAEDKIGELIEYCRVLRDKLKAGVTLTPVELKELAAAEEILKKKGFSSYLDDDR